MGIKPSQVVGALVMLDASGAESYPPTKPGTATSANALEWTPVPPVVGVPVVWDDLYLMTALGSSTTYVGAGEQWDAGAYSLSGAFASGAKTLKGRINAGVIGAFGLTNVTGVANFAYQQPFSVGLFTIVDKTEMKVIESGLPQVTPVATITDATVIKMTSTVGGVVRVYLDDVLFYTFATSSAGMTLYPFCAGWEAGVLIHEASLEDA